MVTFLFTDIEASIRLWETFRQQMLPVLKLHDGILYDIITNHKGRVIEHTGDGVYAIFEQGHPLEAALEIQKAIAAADWGPVGDLRIRIGLVGRAADRLGIDYFHKEPNAYFGPAINLASRITSAAWGGQILLDPELLTLHSLPDGAQVVDCGLHRLRGMKQHQLIYSLIHPDLPRQTFPPLPTQSSPIHNLPRPATPFINRDDERAILATYLHDPQQRLITLLGPGGIGKSRLSIQVARENAAAFTHGVYFVPLAPVESAGYLVTVIGETLGLGTYHQETARRQLLHFLASKSMLLVLDNFEHMISGVSFLNEVLNTASQVKMLATSRVRLNLKAEQVITVKGMAYPPEAQAIDVGTSQFPLRRPRPDPTAIAEYPAVQLFVEAARRQNPPFTITAENTEHIIRICNLLDGIPLAIELAASWLRLLTCAEIANEIEKSLDILTSSLQDVPYRHRSIRAVFAHSWSLLSAESRTALARLSLFHGGFRREAADHVTGATPQVLATLLDSSLVQQSNTPGRLETHEILRQYAAEKLAENPTAHQRTGRAHAQYYLRFLRQRLPRLKGRQQKAALLEIEEERENIRTAWEWAVAAGNEQYIFRSFEAWMLTLFLASRFQEMEQLFQNLPRPEKLTLHAPDRLKGLQLLTDGIAAFYLGYSDRSVQQLERSLSLLQVAGTEWEKAFAMFYLGGAFVTRGDYTPAKTMLARSHQLWQGQGDLFSVGRCLLPWGVALRMEGHLAQAGKMHQNCHLIFQRLGNQWGQATALYMLAVLDLAQDNPTRARTRFQESLTLYEDLGDIKDVAYALNHLGGIDLKAGNLDRARALFLRSEQLFETIWDRRGLVHVYRHLAQLSIRSNRPEEASSYFHQALSVAVETGMEPVMLEVLVLLGAFLAGRGHRAPAIDIWQRVAGHPAATQSIRDQALAHLQSGANPDYKPAKPADGPSPESLAAYCAKLMDNRQIWE